MNNRFIKKIINAVTALAITAGIFGFTANAVAASDIQTTSSTEKEDFNYVSLGASNVNGYGLHGYNFEGVYEAPFEKNVGNRYGYKMDTPGAYPTLIKEELEKTYNVNYDLIAMSSLRAEELHLLLNNDYWGDSYTDIWFYDTNGDGNSSNWSYNAGLYEWQLRAEAGLEGAFILFITGFICLFF